ncbi:MAG: hypothetical protein F6K04_01370 [Leptolyngbya sp. SIO4C5]|nr:hypothetical protein [Leptolyngbya sp. SIO4C5]
MANFAAASKEKILAYLGYGFSDENEGYVLEAMQRVQSLSDGTLSTNAVSRVEGWLAQLDTIQTKINTERDIDGSTLLAPLRTEGRRFVQLVANALGLDKQIDIFGTSGT